VLAVRIPRRGDVELDHLVLDVNGTLAGDGKLLPGVTERLDRIRDVLAIHLLSADTHGRLDEIARELAIPGIRLLPSEPEPEQKAAFVRRLNRARVVAIGNGANDVAMLAEAAIGIVVLGPEGLAVDALQAADVLVGSIADALDLLLYPQRLIATLRR
jgi:P-type E1-E2 ATPase